jgi:Pseudouridylate synthases, 23S RNA-specific
VSRHVIRAKRGANQRLDKFLTDVVSESSRTTIKKMINEGLVTVNGEVSKPSLILNGNEKISYQIALKEENGSYLTHREPLN